MPSKRARPEDALHEAVADYLRLALSPFVPWSSIAHGGISLPIHTAQRLKRTGLKPGMPDILLIKPDSGRAFFIELKSETGRLSVVQKAMHDLLRAAGCVVEVARSINDVETFLKTHGFPLSAAVM